MAFHVSYRNHITDQESRKWMVAKFQEMINKFGIPARNKWSLEKTSLDYEVHIPIFNYYNPETEIKNVQLIIHYTPPKIANKVYEFNVVSEIDHPKLKPTLAPSTAK